MDEQSLGEVKKAREADRSAADTVVRDLIRGLYDGRIEPGQRLYEAHLTREYSVSRGPVREALNKLAATGIVDLTLQRGARIKVLNFKEALDTLIVAQALLSLAARLAAENIDAPGARGKLIAATSALSNFDATSGSAEFAIARNTFYAALVDIADNDQLAIALPGVRIHLIRVQFRYALQKIDARRQYDYQRISESISAGKPAEAENATRVHFSRAIAAMEEYRGR